MLESEIYNLLKKYEIGVPNFVTFGLNDTPSLDFYPVALKLESKKVVHKSNYGAVKINIVDDEHLAKAKAEIIANVSAKGVVLDESDRFIAVSMVSGEELYFGMVDDDIFGRTALFGKGGVLLEMYKDVCYFDVFATDEEISRAINLTKVSKIFKGFRGSNFKIEDTVKELKKVLRFIKENENIKEFDLNPIILNKDGFFVVDARIKYEEVNKCECTKRVRPNFFENSSVAVIGASDDPKKVGYAIAKNSLSFTDRLYFVNKKGGELFGKKLYQTISEIEDSIDTAVITIPANFVIPSIMELIPKGVKNLIVISAGFKEAGNPEAEKDIKALADKHNINVIGPNCLGYFEATKSLNLTFGTSNIIKGDIALISQSGAVLSALMDKAYQSGVGFSHIISVGNMVDLNFANLINMLNEEDSCKYISIYAEGTKDGVALLNAIRSSKKPVYVFKVGKSEASKKAAFSHTGNLSGNYDMFKGLFESVGVKMVDNIEALLFAPLFEVNDVLVVTNAGGPAAILTDYINERKKRMYELNSEEIAKLNAILPSNWSNNNPVDIIGDAMSGRYKDTLDIVKDFKAELIYVVVTPQFMTDSLEIVKLISNYPKNVIPIVLGGELMQSAKDYLIQNQTLFFDNLKDATAFL